MSFRSLFVDTWRRPDAYASLTTYITARGLLRIARVGMAACTLGYAAIGFMMLARSTTSLTVPECVACLLALIAAFVIGALWLVRWPSPNESRIIVALLTVSISVQALCLADPWGALLCTMVFAVLAGYVATLHGVRLLTAVVVVALIFVAGTALRLSADADPVVVAGAALAIVLNIITLPTVLICVIPAMHLDAQHADIDPLTGLFNRRGMEVALHNWVGNDRNSTGLNITVTIFDLDGFKCVNDTAGHSAGDTLLRHVAATLRSAGEDDLIRGRIGGEEFAVVGSGSGDLARALADYFRLGIADNTWGTTASVGVAAMYLPPGEPAVRRDQVVRLFEIADQQMYRAKRAGGDRVCVSSLPPVA